MKSVTQPMTVSDGGAHAAGADAEPRQGGLPVDRGGGCDRLQPEGERSRAEEVRGGEGKGFHAAGGADAARLPAGIVAGAAAEGRRRQEGRPQVGTPKHQVRSVQGGVPRLEVDGIQNGKRHVLMVMKLQADGPRDRVLCRRRQHVRRRALRRAAEDEEDLHVPRRTHPPLGGQLPRAQ